MSLFELSDVDEFDKCVAKFDNVVVFNADLRSDVVSIQTLLQGVDMGNYAIHIEGTGAHHNGITADADHILGEAVKALKHHGHTVHHASLTYGSRETHAGDEHDARSPVTATSSSPQVNEGTPVDTGDQNDDVKLFDDIEGEDDADHGDDHAHAE